MLRKLDEIIASKGWDTRRKILEELSKKPSTAYELAKKLGMNYSTIRYHLELLERAGLVTADKGNRYVYKITKNVQFLLEDYVSYKR